MGEENKVKQTMIMEVRGTCEKGKPRTRWMDNIRHGMSMCGLEDRDAQDRKRCMSQKPDLASQLDKGEEEDEEEFER